MTPKDLDDLRECCQDAAAFERMQQILLRSEADRQRWELQTLTLLEEQVQGAIRASSSSLPLQSLENLIHDRSAALLSAHTRLQQEIDDRQWAEQALLESEQRFRSLIENATDVIVILDQAGIFRYCSPSAERILGYTLSDVFGRSAAEFIHPSDVALILQVLQTAIAHPRVSQPPVEYWVRRKSGSWCIFEAVTTSLLNDPTIRGVVVNCHDITERKRAERELQTANRRSFNILESITDAFISLDAKGRFTYVNGQAAQLFRRSQAELLRQDIWATLPEILGSTLHRQIDRAFKDQLSTRFEEFYPVLDRWFEVRIFPAADGLSVFFQDVTDRKQAEAALQASEQRLNLTLEATQMGIWSYDPLTQVVTWSEACEGLFGWEPGRFDGKLSTFLGQVHPDDRPGVTQQVSQNPQPNLCIQKEFRVVWTDGSLHWIAERSLTVCDASGAAIMLGISMDVTDRKQSEAALRQQAERERLLGSVSQRIRQSLNLEEILNTTVAGVRQLLNTDRVILCRYLPSKQGQIIAESARSSSGSVLGAAFQIQPWYEDLQADYRQGKSLVIPDARCVPQFPEMEEFLRFQGVSAAIAVPILHGEQLWGTLIANQCSAPRVWESWEVALLEQLATQAAIAIQQSKLYGQVQQLNTELEAQVQERTAQLERALQFESTLKRITDSVRDTLDEDQILHTIVEELGTVLDVEACDVSLHDLERQISTVRCEYTRTNFPSAKNPISMSLFPGIYQQILQEQHLQFCLLHNTVRVSDRFYTTLACPMVSQQGMLGDLWLFKPSEQIFTQGEIRLVQQVANQAAIALRQARLYQESQAQVVALEELNQLKNDFLSTVSHELRTPMSNMKIAIHMLRTVKTPERQERYLSILQAECGREIELINDLLDLQRLEASAYLVLPESIPLRQFLRNLVEPFQTRASDRQQHLSVVLPDRLPDITTDKPGLERILSELLNNACKYTPPLGEIVLEVALDERAGSIGFSVRNQATIPATALLKIFEKFYRVPDADRWKQGGTGLGLALVQKLVGQMGGTIVADSSHGWTSFTIQLPAGTR